MKTETIDVAGYPVRLITSDALPPGTVLLWSPRGGGDWVEPGTGLVPVREPVDEWARRCAVLRTAV